ncbi:MAG: DoxX family membrane protein [Actinomycetota bacterium]|nr:DoxX family membrane protein [Actinomycetota bacterium]
MSLLMGESAGQPEWLHWWFRFWIDLQHPDVTLWAYLAAVIETGIAVALILGFARKLTYIGAIVFSLIIWSTAEGFGGPYTGHSTDVGTAIIYALVFLALLAFDYECGPSRLTVDRWLERRFSWWLRLAEVRRVRANT